MWWKAVEGEDQRRARCQSDAEKRGLTVLGNVTDDQVGVLPDLSTFVRLGLSDEELDEGRLAGTVGSKDGDTRRERNLERDVVELLDGGGGVLESNVTHLHERLLLGLDTVEERRVGELELVLLVDVELVVGLGLGDVLDEGDKVTGVSLNLEAVKVKNVGGDVVEEARVVCERGRRSASGSAQGGERQERYARETMIEVQVLSEHR